MKRSVIALSMLAGVALAGSAQAENYVKGSDLSFLVQPVIRMVPIQPDDSDYGKAFWVSCEISDAGHLQACQADAGHIDNKAYVAVIVDTFDHVVVSTTDRQGRPTVGRKARFLMKVGNDEPRSL